MADLALTFSCGLYDRLVPLYAKEATPAGIDLQFIVNDSPTEAFARMVKGEYDSGELSCSDYLRRTSAGNFPYVAIPVFPSRVFRHSMICVRRDAGIRDPRDLEGKRVGVPSFGMTAALWIRGLLQHEYGVDHTTIEWIQGAPPRPDETRLRERFRIATKPADTSFETLIDDGAIDAFIGADLPEAMLANPNVVRLFPNYRELEREYYERTKIFPIMHVVVIRRTLYEEHPFVAQSLYDALERSKSIAREKLRYTGTLRYMLPWMIADVEEIDAVFGGDPFPYGLAPNRPTLETALQYLGDQALLEGPVDLDQAFVAVKSAV